MLESQVRGHLECPERASRDWRSGLRWNCAEVFRFIAIFSLITIILSSITACGWHLRGSSEAVLTIPPVRLEIQKGGAELRSELPIALKGAGIQLAQKGETAPLILAIHNELQQRRVLAVGKGGKVTEYELQYQLVFSVRDQSGKEVIATDTIRQQREYSFNEGEVLAKADEERQLFSFMRSMVIQTLLLRMQGLSEYNKPVSTTEAQPVAN